jgi:hypothetical protein
VVERILSKDTKDPKVFCILTPQLSFTAGCCSPKILVRMFRLDFPPTGFYGNLFE